MIKKTSSWISSGPIKAFKQYHNQKLFNQLQNHPKKTVRLIATALQETLDTQLDEKEKAKLKQIEDRRQQLLNTTETINVIDYGAGNPTANRTKELMEQGVQSQKQIAHICQASKPFIWSLLLYKLVRKLQPEQCLELGSCVGISAAYQATAQQFNGHGSIISLEGSPEIAKLAEESMNLLNLNNCTIVKGSFQHILEQTLIESKPIQFFFNDGHHDQAAVIDYFNLSLPQLAHEAVVIFDDINWSQGMKNAWKHIIHSNQVSFALDLGEIGIVVVSPDTNKTACYRFFLSN